MKSANEMTALPFDLPIPMHGPQTMYGRNGILHAAITLISPTSGLFATPARPKETCLPRSSLAAL